VILAVRQKGDAVLRTVCGSVPLAGGCVPDDVVKIAEAMVATMTAHSGIGLAANQVGFAIRVVVVANGGAPLVMVNPEIVRADGEQESNEGCLSVAHGFTRGVVRRALRVRVAYTDILGAPRKIKLHGLWAAVAQHEIDHLNGILFTDHVKGKI